MLRLEGSRGEYALGKIRKNAQTRTPTGKLQDEQGHGLLSDHLSSSGHAAAGHLRQRAAVETSYRCERRKGRGYFGDLVRGDPPGWDNRRELGPELAGRRFIVCENRGGVFHAGRMDYPPNKRRIMFHCNIGSGPIEIYAATWPALVKHRQDELSASLRFLEGHEVAAAGHLCVPCCR